MSEKRKPHKDLDINSLSTSCLNILGILSTIFACLITLVAAVWGLRQPDQVKEIIHIISSGDNSTPIVVTVVVNPTFPPSTSTPTKTPTIEPSPTPDLLSTVVAIVAATQAAQPPPTPYPTYTPNPTQVPPTPIIKIATATPVPTPTEPANTPPGSVLEVGEWWKTDNVWLTLKEVKFGGSQIAIYLELWNKTDSDLIFKWAEDVNFTLKDNTRHNYKTGGQIYSRDIFAQNERRLLYRYTDGNAATYNDDHFFDPSVTDMTFTVIDLSRISNAQWHIPVPK